MDNSTFRDLNLVMRERVSPFQQDLQKSHKVNVTETFKHQLMVIWTIPIALTMTEIIFLKHGKVAGANRASLAKWTSYLLAGFGTKLATDEVLRKLHYYDVKLRRPTKMQIENLREYEINRQVARLNY